MVKTYKVAVVQMNSGSNRDDNLEKMGEMIRKAADNNAKLICFPEMVNIFTSPKEFANIAETIDGPTVKFLVEQAGQYNINICGGTFMEKIKDSAKVYNTCVFVGRDKLIKAIYKKRHLFDISLANGKEFRESDDVMAGEGNTVVDTELGTIGIAICYDLRFPEQFRKMTEEGMQLLLLPASFVDETGKAHWETLIRARAIENGCYVLASDQCGDKYNHVTHGNSMIVSPWGEILARADKEESLLFADIDLDYVESVRAQIPSTMIR